MNNEPLKKTGSVGSHTLHLDQRSHAVITGVSDVSSFDENEVILRLDGGIAILSGEGLHIGKLLLDEGRLDVDGRVDSIVYETQVHHTDRFFSKWRRKK